MTTPVTAEQRYLSLLLEPLKGCANYKPKFGTDAEEGVSLEQFKNMYAQDPFYHWVGLDADWMYAAHKAAGGMTSIYRQLGTGCENLFRAIVRDALQLTEEEVAWSYEIERKRKRIVKLDARIDVSHLEEKSELSKRVADWLKRCEVYLGLSQERIGQLRGAIFEVRQGYKSADSKRQDGDILFATKVLAENYLPILTVISTQTSRPVVRRYEKHNMLVMTGVLTDDDITSTYAFFRKVVGFDLDKFFERNSAAMRASCQKVLTALLSPA